MTPAEFHEALRVIGTNPHRLSKALGCNYRTVRRWSSGSPIPRPVVIMLRAACRNPHLWTLLMEETEA